MTVDRSRASRAEHQLLVLQPPDDEGAATRELALQLLRSCPGIEHRSHPGVHLTASAMILDATLSQFLLIRHPKYGRWLQLGGHCDGELDFEAVAVREAVEESGLPDLRVHPAPLNVDLHIGEPGGPPHMHIDVRFLIWAPDGSSLHHPLSPEGHELRWCDTTQLPSETLRRLADEALRVSGDHHEVLAVPEPFTDGLAVASNGEEVARRDDVSKHPCATSGPSGPWPQATRAGDSEGRRSESISPLRL